MRLVGGYLFAVLRTTSQRGSKVSTINFGKARKSFFPSTKNNCIDTRRRMSSSACTQSSQYDENTQSLIGKLKHPFPLVDVDCNLLHEDLTAIHTDSIDAIYQEVNSHLRILHHPSTVASNIHGVFSPSSTIDEAEKFFTVLSESTLKSRNQIDIRMSLGVHPYHTNIDDIGNLSEIESEVTERVATLIEKDSLNDCKLITCIGETGLDYSDGFPDREVQLPWFEYQLKLAKKYNLPLFLHERLAFDDTIALIEKVFTEEDARPPIIIHCFTGNKEECEKYVKEGFYISVSGYILKNGEGPEEVRECLRNGVIPMDKLMIETDAPYMGFNSCRGTYYQVETQINEEFQALNGKKKKRLMKGIYPNVPSSLPKIFDYAVELINDGRKERGEEALNVENAARTFFQNSINFFGLQLKYNLD